MSWTNKVNSGKFMDNCWISCQVMADMENFYDDLIIIYLYLYYIKTNYSPLMINVWPPILVSSWVVGAYLHLLFILYGTNPKWGEKVHYIFFTLSDCALKKPFNQFVFTLMLHYLEKCKLEEKSLMFFLTSQWLNLQFPKNYSGAAYLFFSFF